MRSGWAERGATAHSTARVPFLAISKRRSCWDKRAATSMLECNAGYAMQVV